jgi:hypothetical protein
LASAQRNPAAFRVVSWSGITSCPGAKDGGLASCEGRWRDEEDKLEACNSGHGDCSWTAEE